MTRVRKPKVSESDLKKDLWINPRSNLRGPDGDRGRGTQGNISPSSGSRFLELGDIALGLKHPRPKRKKAATAANDGHHVIDQAKGHSI